jgi:hypothetical protein
VLSARIIRDALFVPRKRNHTPRERVGRSGQISPSKRFRAELSDDGWFCLYMPRMFREEKVLWASLDQLVLKVWTDVVQSGGGFVGGGFGAVGAAEGMLAAGVLNALTARRREYALLGVFVLLGDGSKRELVLGFRDLSESTLRERLFRAIPAWTDRFVNIFLNWLQTDSTITEQIAKNCYIHLQHAAERGLLSLEQIETMRSGLARFAPPPERPSLPENDRVAKLKTLADLRASGALTQVEFETAKARLLST